MQFEHVFFEGIAPVPRRDEKPHAPAKRRAVETRSEEIGGFMGTLFLRAQLPVASYHAAALRRRTAACLRFLGASDVETAARKIQSDPSLVQPTLSVALLGVSEFFRDADVFARLRGDILPQLLQAHVRPRIWSAACSAGQELYSVAMLLADSGQLGRCELLGTDCRAEAVEQARRGAFEPASMATLEPEWRERFFERSGRQAVVRGGLRWATKWKCADLLSALEPGPWHLILWRNMAIYLEPPAAARIWRQLAEQLEPGGYLVCGKADHPPGGLPLARVGRCLYQRVSFSE